MLVRRDSGSAADRKTSGYTSGGHASSFSLFNVIIPRFPLSLPSSSSPTSNCSSEDYTEVVLTRHVPMPRLSSTLGTSTRGCCHLEITGSNSDMVIIALNAYVIRYVLIFSIHFPSSINSHMGPTVPICMLFSVS